MSDAELQLVFSVISHRQVSKDLCFSFQKRLYSISDNNGAGYWRIKRDGVFIHRCYDGEMVVVAGGYRLTVNAIGDAAPDASARIGSQYLNGELDRLLLKRKKQRRVYRPPMSHPYKRQYYEIQLARRKP